jgi:hypothetical protein
VDKLPFSVYDFFAYLSSGFVLLVGLAAAFAGSNDWQETPSTVVGLLLIVIAYSVGHVVATISGHMLEGVLVRGILGTPTVNLLRSGDAPPWARIMPGYYRALPASQRDRVLEKAKAKAGITKPGEALFYHCFATVKEREPVMARLNTFLNLYGFCRNMAVAAFLVGIALAIGMLLGSAHTGSLVPPGWWAAGSVAGAVALVYRYLKFFRHYSVEVLISYTETE